MILRNRQIEAKLQNARENIIRLCESLTSSSFIISGNNALNYRALSVEKIWLAACIILYRL